METDPEDRHLFIPLANQTVAALERGTPLECIAAVVEMAGWVEEVLREFVDDARADGSDWGQIAIALGVTKQAAWQRYRRPDAPRTAGSIDYLTSDVIWSCLLRLMKPAQWYSLDEIYRLVLSKNDLTPADQEPDAPGSSSPRWQRNVRNVLQRRKTSGDLEWDGHGSYRIPPPL